MSSGYVFYDGRRERGRGVYELPCEYYVRDGKRCDRGMSVWSRVHRTKRGPVHVM
jgi:hypothetical protein